MGITFWLGVITGVLLCVVLAGVALWKIVRLERIAEQHAEYWREVRNTRALLSLSEREKAQHFFYHVLVPHMACFRVYWFPDGEYPEQRNSEFITELRRHIALYHWQLEWCRMGCHWKVTRLSG